MEKFIGDAVVATFGVPHASEHDGTRAVGVGLAIIAAVAEVADGLHLPPGTLQVRVGVNTGEVHASPAADGAWRLTGNVMNVAARLQAAADPGTVLIGAGYRARGRADVRPAIRGRPRVEGEVRTGAGLAGRLPAGRTFPSRTSPRFCRPDARPRTGARVVAPFAQRIRPRHQLVAGHRAAGGRQDPPGR